MNTGFLRRASLAKLGGCRDGSVVVEFALILPLLMLMIVGTFQYGVLMFSYNLMLDAARDTTRQMAVCNITDGGAAATRALSGLPQWVPAGAWIIDAQPAAANGTVSTKITIDPAATTVFNLVPMPGPIVAYSTMLKEPLAFQQGPCS